MHLYDVFIMTPQILVNATNNNELGKVPIWHETKASGIYKIVHSGSLKSLFQTQNVLKILNEASNSFVPTITSN